MNSNVLNFYLQANKLKEVLRSGWIEVGISSDRIESVAEHVYGSFVLAIALDSEQKLELDMLKVFKMIIIKELEKVTLKEVTPNNHQSAEERKELSKKTIMEITNGLLNQQELIDLSEEINKKESKEAIFVYQLCKIESDIQAKIYDLNGHFNKENALEDAKNYGEELSKEIIPQIKNASDGWILFDRRYYTDEIFKQLSKDVQNMGNN